MLEQIHDLLQKDKKKNKLKSSQNLSKDFGMVLVLMKDKFLLSALQVLQETNQQKISNLKKNLKKILKESHSKKNKTSSPNYSRSNSDKSKRKMLTINGIV